VSGLLTRLDNYDCCADDPACPVCEAGREIEALRSEVERLRSIAYFNLVGRQRFRPAVRYAMTPRRAP
jgi:hypothetical protein